MNTIPKPADAAILTHVLEHCRTLDDVFRHLREHPEDAMTEDEIHAVYEDILRQRKDQSDGDDYA